MKNPVRKQRNPDLMPQYVVSDLVCTICLRPFNRFSGKNGLRQLSIFMLIDPLSVAVHVDGSQGPFDFILLF